MQFENLVMYIVIEEEIIVCSWYINYTEPYIQCKLSHTFTLYIAVRQKTKISIGICTGIDSEDYLLLVGNTQWVTPLTIVNPLCFYSLVLGVKKTFAIFHL